MFADFAGQGSQLTPNILLAGYTEGIFPMAEGNDIFWYSPEERGVIPLDDRFHINHGLRRAMRKKPFEIHINRDFEGVIRACGERQETWIDERIVKAYCALYDRGFGLSVECWDEDGLQGGLYGIAYKKAFFGESMFSRKSNASKIAMVHLVEHLRARDFLLLDTQWVTSHLQTFGGYSISREEYLDQLANALA